MSEPIKCKLFTKYVIAAKLSDDHVFIFNVLYDSEQLAQDGIDKLKQSAYTYKIIPIQIPCTI